MFAARRSRLPAAALLSALALQPPAALAGAPAAPATTAGEAGGEAKACCHKKPGDAAAALPAGMSGEPDAPEAAGPASAGLPPTVAVTLRDAPLLDQDGRPVRFGRDVVGDRIVVVDFVFTTCTTICPILSAKLARLQERLAERLGKEVSLVSVSIDPARDTPARLKAFAARFKARPGWTWLTGDKADVDEVLRGLGAYTVNFAEHAPMMLVGDGRTGRWGRFNGFPDPERLLAAVDALAAARPATTAARD